MIETIHFPRQLTGPELDFYLSIGWYRMGQSIFTTHFIPIGDKIHRVFWLRLIVGNVQFGRKQRRLLRLNQDMSVHYRPFLPSADLDELYTAYRSSVDFDAPSSIAGFLLSEAQETYSNIYDTHTIELRENGRLAAVGIYDLGQNSMAGIMNFYHPDYSARSLGKYLMLLKISLAREMGLTYYYPGYLVSGYPKFDYKLFADRARTEWYEPVNNQWLSLQQYDYPEMPGIDLREP